MQVDAHCVGNGWKGASIHRLPEGVDSPCAQISQFYLGIDISLIADLN